jgi:hypothetical protein
VKVWNYIFCFAYQHRHYQATISCPMIVGAHSCVIAINNPLRQMIEMHLFVGELDTFFL